MKKRFLALIGATVIVFGLTACGADNSNGNNTDGGNTDGVETTVDDNNGDNTDEGNTDNADSSAQSLGAVDAFEAIFNLYGDDDFFPIMGGDVANVVDNKPGKYDLSDKDGLMGLYYIPESQIDSVDDVATAMHMMNANTFSGVVAHVSDTKAFADDVKTQIVGTQWVCGFPDRLIVAEISDGYVAYAFGEASIMDTFAAKLMEAYPAANIIHDVNLTE